MSAARELPFHKIVDWDATAGRFVCDPTYDQKQPDLAHQLAAIASHTCRGPVVVRVGASVGRPGASAHAECRRRRGIDRARWILQRLPGGRPPGP